MYNNFLSFSHRSITLPLEKDILYCIVTIYIK